MASFIKSDLVFILEQILISEAHATGEDLSTLVPNNFVPFGLRTVDGSFNHIFFGQSQFGAADNLFPRMLDPVFRNDLDGDTFDANGPALGGLITNTDYASPGSVVDADPRIISNLIVDNTVNNAAAYAAAAGEDGVLGTEDDRGELVTGTRMDGSTFETFFIPNVATDEGLSMPFNSWFTFFGQFFDHGLDLVKKGGNGTVFMPLQNDDPLVLGADGVLGTPDDLPESQRFMVLTRATTTDQEHHNQTSPFVDQNQTYASHASHQAFLRAYELNAAGQPVATGKLIVGRTAGEDGTPGNEDDVVGGMATWKILKAQARDILGIDLTDADFDNVPLLATDPYGNFLKGPNGFPQVVMAATAAGRDGIEGDDPATLDVDESLDDGQEWLAEGNPAAPISLAGAVRTGHAFLNDVAHNAVPGTVFDDDNNPATPAVVVQADLDDEAGNFIATDAFGRKVAYDDELLDAHYMAGDGRVNENIGLTAVHHVFHAEHNRLVDHTKDVILESGDLDFLTAWLMPDTAPATFPVTDAEKAALVWNGERLFQAAKFGTEMQYQHLVFEEFARKVQPMVDVFLAPEGFDTEINPAIVAEFAHTVYRFGHSMLTETVDRLDPTFESSPIGLIQAFLNPLEFAASGATPEEAAGAIVRGLTRQVGNEIDEFVTEALRNNLLGLPLDLPSINIARGRDTGIPSLNAARREFYDMTSDSQLKPYTSWVDLVANLRHEASLVNFIAAYGTHQSILDATTLAGKRAAADLIVFGDRPGPDGILADDPSTEIDESADNILAPADRLDFLYSTGAYASGPDGVTTTGVDDIDFWMGGLAEKQMPFGGLLGSTFNFVFETQLESLQNADRFYYLARLAGLNFLTEMENNSFAKLVMLHTDVRHLPAEIFNTPTFTLEVDGNQFTGEGADGRADPVGGTALIPFVLRDDPATPGEDLNYLRYTGPDHVVLGGTAGDDTMISSEGDDTLWGDGGNDRLEGGAGVDNIEGGDGDDIITDKSFDDVLKGNAGHDVISGGDGFNLILGGTGNDFIITGEDVSETFGGEGNDFILGAQMNLPTLGNEGDDWIEIGTSDGAGGDNFAPLENSSVIGHDVFITGGGFDEVDGEGGDDIMVFSDAEDHFGGGGGFDWASYKNDRFGVNADLNVNDAVEPPVTASNQGLLDRFADVEGLSGSAFSDVLRGDDATTADMAIPGPLNNVLTRVDLIDGLQALLGSNLSQFGSGNIILGGDGSDILEGRGGDDLIDGDRWLNVRISVHAGFDPNGPTGPEIATFDSLDNPTLLMNMLDGVWNPGQLGITREILTAAGPDFDTAMFSGRLADYTIFIGGDGTVHVTNSVAGVVLGFDGTDTLKNIERLQFSPDPDANPLTNPQQFTGRVILAPGLNSEPVGSLAIEGLDGLAPAVNQVLTVSAALVTDADNPTGAITDRPIHFVWQFEPLAGTGVFQDIIAVGGGKPATQHGNTFQVTPDLAGFALRVRAVYEDGDGTLENVFSNPTAAVSGVIPLAPVAAAPEESDTTSPGGGLHFIRGDLQFILDQIKIAEANPDGSILDTIENSRLPFGLRTVDGSFNNLVVDQTHFGQADQNFPLLLEQVFRPAQGGTSYAQTTGLVVDSDPRTISNLIVDMTANNPAAVEANGGADPVFSPGLDGVFGTPDDREVFFIPNTTPDAGLSAPFNAWFVFFGQFFDHGLDLVDKGGQGTVFMPLMPDDPLVLGADGVLGTPDDLPASQRFMLLTRATNTAVHAGADGVFGTADDDHFHNNETTPFVDQNQTYTSNPSHQAFLREYAFSVDSISVDTDGDEIADARDGIADSFAVNTGRLIDGVNGGIGNWAEIKAQAAKFLGIQLTDADIFDAPLIAIDAYGRFIPGANGFAQIVTNLGLVEGVAGGLDLNNIVVMVDGSPVVAIAGRTGHAFLNDIAHNAVPVFGPGGVLVADSDTDAGNPVSVNPFSGRNLEYDNELLDAHFITGDGRGNENIGLTAVHFVFHAEHNRLVQHIKDVAFASNDAAFLNEWLLTPTTLTSADISAINSIADPMARAAAVSEAIDALTWDGERIFQAARFGTEMQYQHLVFEEFGRKIQPQIDIFLGEGQGYDTTINPAIMAEFAHVVYRFGHSMLTETVDRFDPDFNVIRADPLHPAQDASDHQIGLIAAFLNPLAFTASGATDAEAAGALVRGLTRSSGNEIDEFVTEALRNNLVGLPLDLPAINLARGRDTGVPTLNQARAEFYAMTGDTQLKPYVSWIDFAGNIKHEASLVNFIAAYGTHATLTGATTLAAKRAAADLLVYGNRTIDPDGIPGNGDETIVLAPADRQAFLNGPAESTGLNAVDLWIGGLAEKQMPFGGMLGSTFNFVFETQMENLQNGDRFYYLERTAGLNFLTELESNSFARLIMANTDATHLPGGVFSTPAFTLEVNQALQFTGLGLSGRDDPEGGSALVPLVIRDDPATPGPDGNYLRYTGVDHVTLGGTAGNDTLIASIGDDTLYGDAGNDRLDGGDGVDMILGGPGDDIITDRGGDDNLQGGDGNDAIHGGNGINLILGGFGNDFIVTGEDESEAFGGPGNDFIRGIKPVEMLFGNEGDDWLEHGMADGSSGENFDVRGLDAIAGNDVFIGDTVADRMGGEGGDDIMKGNGGRGDRYIGGSGFDWAVFTHDSLGSQADLRMRAFDETPAPLSQASALPRFDSVQGVSGSAFSDILEGDDLDALLIAISGFRGSVLTNFDLIEGLREFVAIKRGSGVDDPLTLDVDESFTAPLVGPDGIEGTSDDQFGEGNIILGGAGSDFLTGHGGNDLIDGDAWLDVYISVRANSDGTGDEIGTAATMTELMDEVFAGEINPGQLTIARRLDAGVPETLVDTVFYTGVSSEYQLLTDPLTGAITIIHDPLGDGVLGVDGIDRLTNIERIQFADTALSLGGVNAQPDGFLQIIDNTPGDGIVQPVEDTALTVSASVPGFEVTDLDNVSATNPTGAVDAGLIAYFWQFEPVLDSGVFEDIIIPTGLGDLRATGTTFTPSDLEVGTRLRVRAVYQDAGGNLEIVFSAATEVVANLDDAPAGALLISDPTPTETQANFAINQIIDADGLTAAVFAYQWQQAEVEGVGGGASGFVDIAGATAQTFTPGAAQVNFELRVVVTYTDDNGNLETVFSAPTTVTGDFFIGTADDNTWSGTEGEDIAFGRAGGDTLIGLGGNDILDGEAGEDAIFGGSGDDLITGGTGDDVLFGEAGDDTFEYTVGNHGADAVDGGADLDGTDLDTLNISGTAGNNALDVLFNGTVLTEFEDGTLAGVESVRADLGAGLDDALSYVDTLAPVNVDLTAGTASGFTGIAGIENVTGGDGSDTLVGAAGVANAFTGGDGDDTFTVHDETDTVSEALDGGIDHVLSVSNVFTIADGDVENLTFIGVGNFVGTGNNSANVITGGSGHDTLTGLGAGDTLNGGDGNDSLAGGTGADILNGGLGQDTFEYAMGGGADAVDGDGDTDTLRITGGAANDTLDVLYNGTALTNFEGGTIVEVESVTADVNGGIDELEYTGTTANVTVNLTTGAASGFTSIVGFENATGGSNNDSLTGVAGEVNVLVGGDGSDTFTVHDINDVVSDAGVGTELVLSLSDTYTIVDADVENLTYIGTGDFVGTGNGSANEITGGAGADTLAGLGGNDSLFGMAGSDIFDYSMQGGGADSVDGGDDSDTLNIAGTAAANVLNVLYNGTSLTDFEGGTIVNVESVNATVGDGTDELNYAGTAAGVTVDLSAGTASGFASIAGFENVRGGDGGDTLTGDGLSNVLDGGAGNDTLSGGDGVDTLAGGSGDDTLDGGLGDDVLDGGTGADTYTVDSAADQVIDQGGGIDLVQSLSTTYTLADADVENLTFIGGNQAFTGTGNAAANEITGDVGNDTLLGLGGADTLNGGDGDDSLTGGAANDTLNGGAGNDSFTYVMGDGADAVNGGADVDSLSISGGAANDTLDVIYDGSALTSFEGGTIVEVESVSAAVNGGADTLTYAGTTAGVTVDLALGTASGFTSISGFENVTGGSGADSLTGDAAVNNLTGGAGDDTYVASNVDTITEGTGAASGTDSVFTASNTFTLATNVENLTFDAPTGNFAGTGNASNNVITGGSGNDTLLGLGGIDTLNGGDGDDSLTGGAANDTLNGGAGNDTFSYVMGDGADTVNGGGDSDTLNITAAAAAADQLDVVFDGTALTSVELGAVSGLEFVTANLNGGTDTLSYAGTAAAVTVNLSTGSASGFLSSIPGASAILNIENVTGGSGDDSLTGRAGVVNVLAGGLGSDTYVVHEANDVVTETGAGIDQVNSFSNSFNLGGNVENLTFVGVGNFTGNGNALNNVIIGGAGIDNLSGAGGDDTLNGGLSNDTLTGGTGNDTYIANNGDNVVEAAGAGTDLVLTASASFTLAANVENLTYSALTGDFSGTGNALANVISGGSGNDTLVGLLGNDSLFGNDGNDTFNYVMGDGADSVNGGAGDDTLNINTGVAAVNDVLDAVFDGTALTSVEGGAVSGVEFVNADLNGGTDTLSYAATGASVTVVVDLSSGSASGFATIVDIENVTGGAGNDLLTGDLGANSLVGGGGDDTLDGGGAIDTLAGGAGNDTYIATNDDLLSEAGAGTDLVLTESLSFTLGNNFENLTFIGSTGDFIGTGNGAANVITGGGGNDALLGLGDNDTLNGEGGNDTLNGGAGNDSLSGGAGDDSLTGAGGTDVFVFAPGFGADTITDFDGDGAGGQDRLDVSAYGFADEAALLAAATIEVGDFDAGATAALDTRVTLGLDTIVLIAVGAGANVIAADDFILTA